MLKDIWIPSLLDILPQNIQADKKLNAAAAALDLQLKALSNEAWQVLHIPRLDELNHDVLDHLAYQFHVDHYEPSTMALETKRNLIRQSILWHRIKGTPASVENFLGAFGIKTEVQEWYEYGGDPYFFKLKLSEVAFLGDEGETFIRLVYAAKNERSWLDKFIFDLTTDQAQYIYPAQITQNCTADGIDYADIAPSKNGIYLVSHTANCTAETIDYDFDLKVKRNDIWVSFHVGIGGYEIIDAEMPRDDFDPDYWGVLYKRWQVWSKNPVVKVYSHHFSLSFDDGEVEDPDPEEFYGGDILKLYFKHSDGRVRIVPMPHPRDNITGSDIKTLGLWVGQNKVLFNSRKKPAEEIIRAVYITKNVERIL